MPVKDGAAAEAIPEASRSPQFLALGRMQTEQLIVQYLITRLKAEKAGSRSFAVN